MTWATRSIGQPHAHCREARGEWALGTLPPGDAAPSALGQRISGVLSRLAWHRMQPRLAPVCLGEEQAHTGREDLQCAGNRPGQATGAEPLAERSPAAVSGNPPARSQSARRPPSSGRFRSARSAAWFARYALPPAHRPWRNVQDRQSTCSAGRAAIRPAPALHAKTGSATPRIGSSPACPERHSIVPPPRLRRYLSSAARCRRSPAPHRRHQRADPPVRPRPATAVHHPRPGC